MKTMSFKRKGMSMFDLHLDLILILHLVSHNFQILFFRFSLKQVARGDTYHRKKWKQKLVLRQATSLKVTSIRHWNKIKKATSRTHWYFIDFQGHIDVELSTSNWCHSLHLDSPFIIDEISTNFDVEIRNR